MTLNVKGGGSLILVTWNATVALNNDDPKNLVTVAATFRLYRNATQVYRSDMATPVMQNSGIFLPLSMQFQDTDAVGATTYRLRWSVLGFDGGPAALGLAAGSVLQATELR